MDSFIETLNHWGGNFLPIAWPMLWQSSLLIATVLVFDFLWRRQLRASIRYALWLVVLVKLILPPTLALPTSPAWWLYPTPPTALAVMVSAKKFAVTYDQTPLPEMPETTVPVFVPPPPTLNFAAWLLIISAFTSAGLLVWLLARWWHITRQVRRAEISERLTVLTCDVKRQAGMRFKSPLVKLTAKTLSPAVCGLFRSTILIPQSLAAEFSDEQMRAVLLHELIHLRRRDVWLNFLQSLLQIVYWWHPLVWVANARIRHVREEAVDDAVMLSLGGSAEIYAPTLLEVAKLALNRPLASLGLVGILESRSALRQRIERLVNFSAPRKAGLTLVSWLGILVFSAVAVPMGEGSGPTNSTLPDTNGNLRQTNLFSQKEQTQSPLFQRTFKLDTNVFIPNLQKAGWPVNGATNVSLAVRNFFTRLGVDLAAPKGKSVFWNDHLSQLFVKATESDLDTIDRALQILNAPVSDSSQVAGILSNPNFQAALQALEKRTGTDVLAEPEVVKRGPRSSRVNTMSDRVNALDPSVLAAMQQKLSWTNSASAPVVGVVSVVNSKVDASNLVQTTRQNPKAVPVLPAGHQIIFEKLNHIQLDQVHFENASLSEVLRQLWKDAKLGDPDRKGVNFMINPNPDQSGPPIIGRATGLLITHATSQSAETIDLGTNVTVTLNLTNVSLAQVLDTILKVANHPSGHQLKYSIRDYGVEFGDKGADVPQLFARTFIVDPLAFYSALKDTSSGFSANTNVSANVAAAEKEFFHNIGVDLESPKGKSIFYNERLRLLFVKATEDDLDTIARTIEAINQIAPQIHIKTRFIEVPEKVFQAMAPDLFPNADMKSGTNGWHALLTNEKFQMVLNQMLSLGTSEGEQLAAPEVVLTTGRQAQMRETQVLTIITNFTFLKNLTNSEASSVTPQASPLETGPMIDVVPYVLADGFTINLTAIPSITDFLGYDLPPKESISKNDDAIHLPVILPVTRVQQAIVNVNLLDHQTLVIGKIPKHFYVNGIELAGEPDSFKKAKKKKNEPNVADTELLIFVTATIVDPAGNRVYSDDELPFAQTGFPAQPPPLNSSKDLPK